MKKLALFLAFALILSCFAGCGEREKSPQEVSSDTTASQNFEIPAWQDEYVKKAIDKLKTEQKKTQVTENQYLEIKNTRLIKIKEDATDPYEIFDDVDCIVEFMLLTNIYDSAPYYFYATDSYAIYKNGVVKEHDAFNLYRNRTYSAEFDNIIEEIYDLKDNYNEICDLENHQPTVSTLPDSKPIRNDVNFEIRDEDDNVLLTVADIETLTPIYQDEQYYLKIEFTEGGALRLKDATEQNLGKSLPIYLDGKLLAKPSVYDAISNGIVMLSVVDEFTLLDIFEKLTK